jgi:hypothetical protein
MITEIVCYLVMAGSAVSGLILWIEAEREHGRRSNSFPASSGGNQLGETVRKG